MAEDEKIIKRRLMLDGDGTGDDRRLNTLLKQVSKFCLNDSEDPEDDKKLFNEILSQLAQCEHSRRRSSILKKRNEKELQQFREFRANVELRMETINAAINQSKAVLMRMQSEKKNRIDYDLLANVILTEPAKTVTGDQISQMKLEIQESRKELEMLTNQLDFYRKQFHVIITSSNAVKSHLENHSQV